MLNGSPRASTGLLRSVLEMLLLHCWWQQRISRKGSSEYFYDWLEGRRKKPKFREIVENSFEWLGMIPDDAAKERVWCTYDRLCSYVHAPIREESATMLNQGNIDQVGVGVLRLWLRMQGKPPRGSRYKVNPHPFAFKLGVDVDRLHQLVDELEAEELARQRTR